MHAVLRKYAGKGAKELIDLIEKNKSAIVALLRQVPGFVSYTLARTEAGGFSVTVCQDQAGISESNRIAREWIAQHAQGITVAAPEVTAGGVIAHSA